MRFPRNDEIVTEHSTPTPDPAAAHADQSLRVIFWLRRLSRWLGWLLSGVLLLLSLAFLLFRFYVLPNLDGWRPWLASQASAVVGMPVSLGKLQGQWQWLGPRFTISQLQVRPDPGSPPITVRSTLVQPSWQSLLFLEPRLALLRLDGLSLDLSRRTNGHLYLNGIDLSAGKGDGAGVDWLLRQGEVSVSLQRFSWQDHLLGLPAFTARQLTATLNNTLLGHRLRAVALPAASQLSHVDFDASWQGSRLRDWPQWHGSATLQADAQQLNWLQRYWPGSPLSAGGAASSQVQLAFEAGRLTSLQGKWQLENAALGLPGEKATALPRLAGEVDYRSPAAGQHQLSAKHLYLQTLFGSLLQDAAVSARWHDTQGGFVEASGLQLAPVLPLLRPHVPAVADSAIRQLQGQLQGMRWQWQGPLQQPRQYLFKTRFSELAPQTDAANMTLTGGLSGELLAGSQQGRLSLVASPMQLALPGQLKQPLRILSGEGELRWQRQGTGWQLAIPALAVATPDFSARLQGQVRLPGQGASQSDLQLAIDNVAINRVPAYLPQLIGADTLAWLQAALQGGQARQVRATLQGDVMQFPFAGGVGGRFTVDARVAGGKLRFDPAWPLIDGIDGEYRMRNDAIEVAATRAATAGISLRQVQVRLPDTMKDTQTLQIAGLADGELATMLGYTRLSPVDGWLGGFLSTLDASGPGKLKLGLAIPLDDAEKTRVSGDVSLAGNTLQLRSLPLPPLTDIQGGLHFNEHGIASPGIDYRAFGGRSRLQASLDARGRMQFTSQGQVDVQQVLQQYVPFLTPYAQGQTDYKADFTVSNNLDALAVQSSLQGVSTTVPAPLAKASEQSWPLQLGVFATQTGWQVDWQIPQHAQGLVALGHDGQLLGAGVGVGAEAPVPEGRIAIKVDAPVLQLAPWLAALPESQADGGEWALPLSLGIATPRFMAQGKVLNNVQAALGWHGGESPVALNIKAREVSGTLQYMPRGKGRLQARLAHLALPLEDDGQPAASEAEPEITIPGLDVDIAALQWKDKVLGSLSLKAQHQPQLWLLDEVLLQTPEGKLTMSGAAPEGKSSGARRTEISFAANSQNAGALLARLGVPDALVGGEGELNGRVNWLGHAAAFDLARMSGSVKLDLRKGRFAQIDPGAARLLGVLSLQSLSRRIRLDFTDVFSSGFAFDSLTGSAEIDAGVFRSSNVLLQGPAAKVTLQGEADLANNRQQVAVRITPTLSEGVAVLTGASLLNPVLGAITFAAQKLLKDPVSQILSFDYEVTGSLADPQVRKVGQRVENKPVAAPAAP